MTDKEFDQLIQGKLKDFQPEFESSWDDLEKRVQAEVEPPVDPIDNLVRAAVGQFAVSESHGDWSEMERRIDADEASLFDDEVRESVENFEAPYDHQSWPILDNKIAADERFHRYLFGAKILEVAAILIAIFTFYQVFPDIKSSISNRKANQEFAQVFQDQDNAGIAEMSKVVSQPDVVTNNTDAAQNNLDAAEFGSISNMASAGTNDQGFVNTTAEALTPPELGASVFEMNDANDYAVRNVSPIAMLIADDVSPLQKPSSSNVVSDYTKGYLEGKHLTASRELVNVDMLTYEEGSSVDLTIPAPVVVGRYRNVRFSFSGSLDLNALYMPGEQFYSKGKKIKFSEKELLATGYSAGAGVLFDRGIWSFETGLYYSYKSYEPNRILQIGKTFDVRTLDFSEISLHVISVPLLLHWNFDRKGKTRFYAFGGTGINIIASANYDLHASNVFRSAPPGGPPSNNETDFEVERVREHILDGAEFRAKSYITAVIGVGVEHYLSNKFSIFAQPSFNYQIPFVNFSDQNGKQLQNISMQIGTRVRLK